MSWGQAWVVVTGESLNEIKNRFHMCRPRACCQCGVSGHRPPTKGPRFVGRHRCRTNLLGRKRRHPSGPVLESAGRNWQCDSGQHRRCYRHRHGRPHTRPTRWLCILDKLWCSTHGFAHQSLRFWGNRPRKHNSWWVSLGHRRQPRHEQIDVRGLDSRRYVQAQSGRK